MRPNLLLTVCGAALLAIGPASAQTIQSEPPAAAPPSLESSPPGTPRTYEAPDRMPESGTQDRTDLGRDCANARTRVQETICKNSDLVAMDRDVARFAGSLPGSAKQGAWVQQLEGCEASATTVYDGPIYNCLRARYEARLVQLSKMAGGTISGKYRLTSRRGSGELTVVEWPQGQATVHFNMTTADGARACGTRMDAQLSQGVIEGSPNRLPGCRVAIQISGGTANVQSNGCTALCELGERVDGTYLSLGAIAPAAPPSRGTPAPKPAAPKNTAPRY